MVDILSAGIMSERVRPVKDDNVAVVAVEVVPVPVDVWALVEGGILLSRRILSADACDFRFGLFWSTLKDWVRFINNRWKEGRREREREVSQNFGEQREVFAKNLHKKWFKQKNIVIGQQERLRMCLKITKWQFW